MKLLLISTVLILTNSLLGCGGDSNNDRGVNQAVTKNGKLNLNLTDAPVDNATAVMVTITGLTLKPEQGSAFDLPLSGPSVTPATGYITINLLSLQNGQTLPLLTEAAIPAGTYSWIRLKLLDSSAYSAYIEWDDQQNSISPLALPADKDQLKTSGQFSVSTSETADYTIHWDLRKSVVDTAQGYLLKPVLHLFEDSNSARVSGTVINPLFSSCATGDAMAIYVYQEWDLVPDDMGSDRLEPLTTATVAETGEFSIGPLDPGTYTLAFTCDGGLDQPEVDDNLTFPEAGQQEIILYSGNNGSISIP